jgi:predicted outer membrane repeat protein
MHHINMHVLSLLAGGARRMLVVTTLAVGFVVVVLALLQPSMAFAAGPWYVKPGGSDGAACNTPATACASIQAAVNKAGAGDTIFVASGTYSVSAGGEVVNIPVTLTLSGGWNAMFTTQSGASVVDGRNSRRGVKIAAVPATIISFTIQNGMTSEGGGGVRTDGRLTLTHVSLMSNTAAGDGGGLHALDRLMVYGGLFQNNRSDTIGGGLYVFGEATLSGTRLISNSAFNQGGGLYAVDATTLSGTPFINNVAGLAGGGLYADSTLSVERGLFRNNRGDVSGGGLYAFGATTLNRTQFISNSTAEEGGGAAVIGAATLKDTQFISNSAGLDGGALFTFSTLSVDEGLFQNNRSGASGGGLYAFGAATLSDTQFISNSATSDGGGVFYAPIVPGSNGRFVNGVFARNNAGSHGAALFLFDPAGAGGTFGIVHATIAGSAGEAIYVGQGIVGITNSILSGYSLDIEAHSAASVNQDYNLFDHAPVFSGTVNSGPNSFAGAPAFFDVAAVNYHLTVDSAAIDAGVNAGVSGDLDGNARPKGDGFDIGAYEFSGGRTYLPLLMR